VGETFAQQKVEMYLEVPAHDKCRKTKRTSGLGLRPRGGEKERGGESSRSKQLDVMDSSTLKEPLAGRFPLKRERTQEALEAKGVPRDPKREQGN